MKPRTVAAVSACAITIALGAAAKALSGPAGWAFPAPVSTAVTVGSGGGPRMFIDRPMSAYPHAGSPVEVFNPNARVLRILLPAG